MANLDHIVCRSLLGSASVGRFATVTEDGAPHVVPCCFLVDEDRLYSVVDGKPKSTTALRRLANIRANPLVSLVVDHYADDWSELWWVRVDGSATVVEDRTPERATALAGLSDKYHQYQADPPLGPLIRVDITGLTGWAFDLGRLPTPG
ncbi:MAG: TIGR03668 family PPOX class F420-dependent oxidoreductase [Actinomycetota bacterium]